MCYTYIMKIDPKQDRRCWCSICEISEEPRTPGEECNFSYIDDNTDEQKCGYD